jgi:Hsp70 protein
VSIDPLTFVRSYSGGVADPVGLSIGTTNLVAARIGVRPMVRRSVLTLYDHQPPVAGLSTQGLATTRPGLVIGGFVERVGDPIPLVAVDGSAHLADRLLVDALGAMADDVGVSDPSSPSRGWTVAVPAYWGPRSVRALADALMRDRKWVANGVPPRLVSDAMAALTALRRDPGLPDDGIIAVVDCGGSGTSITLADAARGFRPVADTLRYPEFSGDQIDHAMMSAMLTDAGESGHSDPAATASVGSLARLRDECRLAKERLSGDAVVVIPIEVPGVSAEIHFTRAELERVIVTRLDGLIDALADFLQRNGLTWSSLSAVAAIGGVSGIPLFGQRLSELGGVQAVTNLQPELTAAVGAALRAADGRDSEAPTGIASRVPDASTTGVGRVGGMRAALAWSENDDRASEPVPYTGFNPYSLNTAEARPRVEYSSPIESAGAREPVRNRLIQFAVGTAALIALVAAGGVAYSLTSASNSTTAPTPTTPGVTTVPAASSIDVLPAPPPPAPPEAAVAAPVEAPAPVITTVAPPPPPRTVTMTVTPSTPPLTTTTTVPTTTTTTTVPTTTTTMTTTTSPPTSTSTTDAPPVPPASTVQMTTTYLTLPFLPVPIPIPVPVPQNPFQQSEQVP